jgi:hypothetical protein
MMMTTAVFIENFQSKVPSVRGRAVCRNFHCQVSFDFFELSYIPFRQPSLTNLNFHLKNYFFLKIVCTLSTIDGTLASPLQAPFMVLHSWVGSYPYPKTLC